MPLSFLRLAAKFKNLTKRLILRNHLIGEVRAIEARDENGGSAQIQMVDDVRSYSRGGGGR